MNRMGGGDVTKRSMAARLARRVADSYKVQSVLHWLGLRATPPGVQSVTDPPFYPHWDGVIPPRRLWVGVEDALAHFVRWPFEYRVYLPLLCGLRVDGSVLELGCNHRR